MNGELMSCLPAMSSNSFHMWANFGLIRVSWRKFECVAERVVKMIDDL